MSQMTTRAISVLQSLLESISNGLETLSAAIISVRNGLETVKTRIRGSARSPHQYFNMLFDWVEYDEMAGYFERFAQLVINGVDPEHAFRMVVNRGNRSISDQL